MAEEELLRIDAIDGGLALFGELDAQTAPRLVAAIDAVAEPELALDMSGVEFVDSSGLRVLIEAHQACDEAGRALIVRRPSASVVRLLQVSGVGDYLTAIAD